MPKVVITGHTSGIGKAISEYFENKGYEVVGFSRSTGYDISNKQDQGRIIFALLNADIFVNNAFNNFDRSQYELLEAAFNCWSQTDKLIINISSSAAGKMQSYYAILKKQLDDFCLSHLYHQPQIINLKPGLTDTPRAEKIPGKRMNTDDIVRVLDFILESRDKVLVSSITFRPA